MVIIMDRTYVMKGNAKTKRLDKYHLIVGMTKQCKLGRCKHCYVEGLQKGASLSIPVIKKAVREFAGISKKESKETGIAHFKGGEPFDEPQKLSELAMFAADLGLDVFVTTNGLSVIDNLDILKKVQETSRGNLRITLSLNGSRPGVDALLRVSPAHFFATVESAKALAAEGIVFEINSVVHKGNTQDIPGMVAFAQELGASQLNILQLIQSGRAAKGELMKADPEEMLGILFDIVRTGDESTRRFLVGSLSDIIEGMRDGCYDLECVAGYRGLLYVDTDGKVYSCPSTADRRFLAGDISSSTVHELMDSKGLQRLRELEVKPGCKGDSLSGGEAAEKMRIAIEREIGTVASALKKEAVCIQKNF
jgi:MoaA/NifB/PqqE/SkfB family radical SAM enzyme